MTSVCVMAWLFSNFASFQKPSSFITLWTKSVFIMALLCNTFLSLKNPAQHCAPLQPSHLCVCVGFTQKKFLCFQSPALPWQNCHHHFYLLLILTLNCNNLPSLQNPSPPWRQRHHHCCVCPGLALQLPEVLRAGDSGLHHYSMW